ncbi:MAG TPA: hypothetical protein VEH56_02125 [Candidatus Saccharimonadales bacterium]|nr:hypothetical protein [Candidatus Saccharimonadales bacterium]
MPSIRTLSVGMLGLLLIVAGVALWVLADSTSVVVSMPLASTGFLWAPLIWFLGIIVILSAALANTLPLKDYLAWLLVLVVGYLAVFVILVSVTSAILP